ncbi:MULTISPECIES: LysM peptidoglycan-binding domain-containing protein [Megasphaera]|uniref:LysM domain protein n=1 Tax=Megasphaera vaginalis (ex Srinivasan et al. 2021) TaxID=1111454 RepID=U7UIN4_9FIRM|nr:MULTISPECIES: LysM peptidoglycan-binding domain-containing protein [Megasphaera]ERT58343.1 LysM domain protein [Megasphaera vaginalis (ex Srinivasan et al. 2021)]
MKKSPKKRGTVRRLRYIALFFVLAAAFMQAGWSYYADKDYVAVRVEEGDTIWKLASSVAEPGSDIRSQVYAIVEANHLSHSEDIRPGQILQIPVEKGTAAAAKAKFSH